MGWMKGAGKRLLGWTGALRRKEVRDRPGGIGAILAMCRRLGWVVDASDGNNVSIPFRDPVVGMRKVYVNSSEDGRYGHVSVLSDAVLRGSFPADVLAYLLVRNGEVEVGAWQAHAGKGSVQFSLEYRVPPESLSDAQLVRVCQILLAEAAEFDARLRKEGLLKTRGGPAGASGSSDRDRGV